MSPEDKKSDFGSITSLLKKTAEDSRKVDPDAGAAPAADSELPSTELPYQLPAAGGEEEQFGGMADQLSDEPLIAMSETEPDPRRERIAHALKLAVVALAAGAVFALLLWLALKKDSLEKRYAQGSQHILNGEDQAADVLFAECLKENPTDARLHAAYARAYLQRGDGDRALEKVQQGLRLEPEQRELLHLQGEIGLQREDFDLADAGARVLRRAYLKELDGYLLQAEIELARKRPEEAVSYLRQAADDHPGDVAVNRLLRRAWLRLGDITRAQSANDELVQQQAAAVTEEDFLDLVELQLALDNPIMAAEFAQAGRKIYPESQRLLKLEVAVAIRGQRYEKAVAGAQQLIARLPSDPAGYFFLGEAAYVRGEYGEALTQLQRAAQIDPRYGPALARLGDLALLRLDDAPGALPYYQRAEAVGHMSGEYWRNYGLALYRTGRFGEAAARWEKAARMLPRSQVVAYNLATAYLLSSRADSAAVQYARCTGLEAVQGRLQNNLGVLAELRGDTSLAAREYLAAREAAAERQFPLPPAERNMARFFRGEALDIERGDAVDPLVLAEEPGR